jgi:hypothetical protein
MNNNFIYEYDQHEADELRLQDQFERKQRQKYAAHPDCRDPDHPGCDKCSESDDDNDD